MKGIKRIMSFGADELVVMHIPNRKKPCLCLYLGDENCYYKVASFNSEETADWFLETMQELFWGEKK